MNKILIVLFSCAALFAEDYKVSEKADSLDLTIYNNNLIMVNDKRSLEINNVGKNKIFFSKVPSQIINESVFVNFDKNIHILSQDYRYDLINFNNILKNNINENVKLQTYIQEDIKGLVETVKLLSLNPLMIQDEGGLIYQVDSKDIIFDSIPSNLSLYPNLLWNVSNQETGVYNIDLKYLSRGVSWNSDYVVNLDNDNLDLNGWITVKNNSGTIFENASLTFLSGEVNQVQKSRLRHLRKTMAISTDFVSESMEVKGESFSNYYIYKVPFKETLRNNETKQISFVNIKKLPFKNYGKVRFNNAQVGITKKDVNQILELDNKTDPKTYPSGIFRVYKKDSMGKSHFIGEDKVKNIRKNDEIILNIGKVYDLKVKRNVKTFDSDYKRRSLSIKEEFEISNENENSVVLKLDREIQPYESVSRFNYLDNCKLTCKISEENRFIKKYEIEIPGNSTFILKIEFDIN